MTRKKTTRARVLLTEIAQCCLRWIHQRAGSWTPFVARFLYAKSQALALPFVANMGSADALEDQLLLNTRKSLP